MKNLSRVSSLSVDSGNDGMPNNTNRRRNNLIGRLTPSLLVGLLIVSMVLCFGNSAYTKAMPSPQSSGGTCFTLKTQTLSYTQNGWVLNTQLSIEDPAKVTDDTKFMSTWKISDHPPQILHSAIKYEPPLTAHFYFDIESQMTVPKDDIQANADSSFWMMTFKEAILPPLQVDELEINIAKVYCNCTCNGRDPASSLPFASETQQTSVPNAVLNNMITAIKCSNKDESAGRLDQRQSIKPPSYDPNDANLWVIFRWQSEDIALLTKEEWTNNDIKDWSARITKRYPIAELIAGKQNRILIIILGRSRRNERWDDFQEQIRKLDRIDVGYLQVADPASSDLAFIKQRLTTLNVSLPILLPVLLDQEQVARAELSVGYPGCASISVPIPINQINTADSSSAGQVKLSFSSFLFVLVRYGTVMCVSLGLIFLAGLFLYRHNPDWFSLRTRLKDIVEFPWEDKL
jgi:hypothetical protein